MSPWIVAGLVIYPPGIWLLACGIGRLLRRSQPPLPRERGPWLADAENAFQWPERSAR